MIVNSEFRLVSQPLLILGFVMVGLGVKVGVWSLAVGGSPALAAGITLLVWSAISDGCVKAAGKSVTDVSRDVETDGNAE